MMAIFPLAAFILLFLAIYQLSSGDDWRHTCIASAILWGAYLVLSTEVLSLARVVTPLGLALDWALMIVFSIGLILRSHRQGKLKLPAWKLPPTWEERSLLLSIAIVVFITLLVAIIAPPATWDSLNYHMPRVAHWAQDRAVHYFPTGIDVQNSMPPGAEMITLNFYVLAGSDKLANLPEWLAVIGCLIAGAYLARLLGAGNRGQWLAAAMIASIPGGIVQASSTMTDAVTAFWVACAAVQAVEISRGKMGWRQVALAGAAGGMTLLTKPTGAAFLASFAVIIAVYLFRQYGAAFLLKSTAAAALIALAINAGQFYRNINLYGNPINNPGRFSEHANQLFTPAGLVSNIVRNAALHTGTPFGHANKLLFDVITGFHRLIGISPEDPRTTAVGPYPWITFRTDEAWTGNFFHAGLILITAVTILLAWKRYETSSRVYTAAAVAGFLLFSCLFKWQIFGARYHLPFFVLSCPFAALVLEKRLRNFSFLTGIILAAAAFPWLFQIDQRPLIRSEQSLTGSILQETRLDLLYANGPHLSHPYETITNKIKEVNCRSVGLMLKGGSAEYPLWVLMDAPQDHRLQMGWIVNGPSSKYEPPGFHPCAVICEGCSQPALNGMQSVYNDNTFQLYLAGSPTQSP